MEHCCCRGGGWTIAAAVVVVVVVVNRRRCCCCCCCCCGDALLLLLLSSSFGRPGLTHYRNHSTVSIITTAGSTGGNCCSFVNRSISSSSIITGIYYYCYRSLSLILFIPIIFFLSFFSFNFEEDGLTRVIFDEAVIPPLRFAKPNLPRGGGLTIGVAWWLLLLLLTS